MLMKALIIALWAGICSLDDVGPQMLRRPLLVGPIVGLIMGDFTQGLIISATLEVMWMGVGNVGAYSAPDMISGTIIGVALGISTNSGAATAVTLALSTSVLCQQLLVIYRSLACALVPYADKLAETGDFKQMKKFMAIPIVPFFLLRAIPCFIGVYFGSIAIQGIIDALPAFIMDGLSVASKIIPGVGLSVLLLSMLKGRMWIFFLVGFMLTTYLGLDIIPVTILAIAFAVLYDMAASNGVSKASDNKPVEEGEYDL